MLWFSIFWFTVGSDFWSVQEKKIFRKAVITENKDFQHIQNMVSSGTLIRYSYSCSLGNLPYNENTSYFAFSDEYCNMAFIILKCTVVLSANKHWKSVSQLQSKTVYQCVEYYYAMKKLKKFKQRIQADKKEGGGLDPVSVFSELRMLNGAFFSL